MLGFSLSSVIGYGTFTLFVLVPALIWLVLRGTASALELIAASVLLVLVAIFAGALIHLLRGGRIPEALEQRIPDKVTQLLEETRTYGVRPGQMAIPAPALSPDLTTYGCSA